MNFGDIAIQTSFDHLGLVVWPPPRLAALLPTLLYPSADAFLQSQLVESISAADVYLSKG